MPVERWCYHQDDRQPRRLTLSHQLMVEDQSPHTQHTPRRKKINHCCPAPRYWQRASRDNQLLPASSAPTHALPPAGFTKRFLVKERPRNPACSRQHRKYRCPSEQRPAQPVTRMACPACSGLAGFQLLAAVTPPSPNVVRFHSFGPIHFPGRRTRPLAFPNNHTPACIPPLHPR